MRSVSRASSVVVGLFVVLTGMAWTQSHPVANPPAFPKVTIGGSEVRTMKSTSTGRDYDLYIHIPSSYGQDKSRKYPVLYILDGQWDFKLMDSVLGGLVYDKFAPEMIMVGITYSGENANYDSLRAMDYTPTAVQDAKGSGDAPKFLKFLKTELIPFMESNYRADSSHRVLQGSSLGGLFTLYTMLTDPGLFSAYVAASPAVPYGDRYAFKQEAEYAKTHKELAVKLYLAVGESEPLSSPVQEFMKTLKSRGYQGLKLETRVIEGERHAGNKPETFNRGLRFVFGD
jgi:predicted alpha/beta superfamily hydrolase